MTGERSLGMADSFEQDSMQDFLAALGSAAAAPGGGAAAGVCAAMSAELVGMVANLTLGKKKYAQVQEQMQTLVSGAAQLSKNFMQLADKDREAFKYLMASYKLPKSTPAEIACRSERIQHACKNAALVPQQVAAGCIEVLLLAQKAVHFGNTQVVTDGASACLLARAALRISAYNVLINTNSIKDKAFNVQILQTMKEYQSRALILEKTVLEETDQILQ